MSAKNPAALDAAAVSARISDGNGWWEVKRNPISKVGVFPYLGSSIANAPDPTRVYNVLRPAEELGSPECLESFKLVPFVDDHTMLGPTSIGLTPAELKGVQGVLGEEVFFDGEYVRANIKVFSEYADERIRAGKRDLSCGYRCRYDWTPGVFNGIPYDAVQRDIRGNHVALVDEGRMGRDVAVLDHFSLDAMEHFTMSDKMKDENGTGEIAEIEAALAKLEPLLAKVEKMRAALTGGSAAAAEIDEAKSLAEALDAAIVKVAKAKEDAKATAVAGLDAALKPINDAIAALTAKVDARFAAMDSAGDVTATAIANIAARDALVTRLTPFIGTFDAKDKTHAEVAAYGCEKLGLVPAKGNEVIALDAYLHDRQPPRAIAHAADAKSGDGVKSALSKFTDGN